MVPAHLGVAVPENFPTGTFYRVGWPAIVASDQPLAIPRRVIAVPDTIHAVI
jgi:hypothetical protein